MSHLPYRKEKNCLNCNTTVVGPFCHHCGQENIEHKESMWHLLEHFFNDITHFDGKLFSTLKLLLFKPGFLSKQYSTGKRVAYLNPVRMYLFSSAIFFFIFFSVYKPDIEAAGRNISESSKDSNGYVMNKKNLQKGEILSTKNKNGWFQKQIELKNIEFKEKYGNDSSAILAALVTKFLHHLSQMLFVLLPLFALVLKLFYFRQKNLYYTDHVIFTIHFYIFLFIATLVNMGLGALSKVSHYGIFNILSNILYILIFFYLYEAMRKFYGQGRAKTILKYFLIFACDFVLALIVFICFLLFSTYEI